MKKVKRFKVLLALVLSFTMLMGFSTTASASWYQHNTPATITAGNSLTSPSRTHDGNYMAIELSGKVTNGSTPAGVGVQLIIAGVAQPNTYYVDFTQKADHKLDWLPIPVGVPIQIRYTCFGCSSVTLTRVISYSWNG